MKTVVLCVDRDDDLGRNTGIRGPVIGVDRNLEAAKRLGLRDPEDTDVNALFGAVKLAREIRAEVATLTGDRNVGLVSDKKVAEQLDVVIKKLKPDAVILVTDGLDDTQVLPIIESRVKINAVQTIVVRQSKELEKAYFKATHFLQEVTEDPNLARLLFGVPGIALLLMAIAGIQAFKLILGLVAGYFILKGFGWEEEFFNNVSGFLKGLSVERISTLIYFISLITLFVSLSYAYGDIQNYGFSLDNPRAGFNSLALFLLNGRSPVYFLGAVIIALVAKTIDDWSVKQFIKVKRYMNLSGFIILVYFIMNSGAAFLMQEQYAFGSFVLTSIMGIAVYTLWTKVTQLWLNAEIDLIKEIISSISGLRVLNKDGMEIGTVSKVIVEDLKLKAVKVGRKYFNEEDFEKVGDAIVLNA